MAYPYPTSGGGGGLSNVFNTFQYWGLTDVMLPFLLIFTVVFAIMQKVKPLGPEGHNKQFNVVIALVMGLGVVIPHVMNYYPPDADIVNIINAALPQVSIVLVAILMVLLIVGLFGGKAEWGGSTLSGWIAFLAFILVAFIFGRSAGWFEYLPSWLYWLDNPDTQAMLLVVGIFAIIIYFIAHEPKEKNESTMAKFGDSVSKLFTGGGGGKK